MTCLVFDETSVSTSPVDQKAVFTVSDALHLTLCDQKLHTAKYIVVRIVQV